LYEIYTFDYDHNYDKATRTLQLNVMNLPAYETATVLLKFPKGIVKKYATLNLDLSPKTQNLWIDGIEIEGVTEVFDGIPSGSHHLKFTASGYKPYETDVTLGEGEERDVKVVLEETLLKKV